MLSSSSESSSSGRSVVLYTAAAGTVLALAATAAAAVYAPPSWSSRGDNDEDGGETEATAQTRQDLVVATAREWAKRMEQAARRCLRVCAESEGAARLREKVREIREYVDPLRQQLAQVVRQRLEQGHSRGSPPPNGKASAGRDVASPKRRGRHSSDREGSPASPRLSVQLRRRPPDGGGAVGAGAGGDVFPLSAPLSATASGRSSIAGVGGSQRVLLGELKMRISREYAEVLPQGRFPLERYTFVHTDGITRIVLMLEDCRAWGDTLTSTAYAERSLRRATEAARARDTYVKVNTHSAASAVVTSVFERYATLSLGSGPVDVVCFFLVRGGLAYTVQLQCEQAVYEQRLPQILNIAQSARPAASAVVPDRGHNEYFLQFAARSSGDGDTPQEHFLLQLPIAFILSSSDEYRTSAVQYDIEYAGASDWRGVITPLRPAAASHIRDPERVRELIPGRLFLYLQPSLEPSPEVLQRIEALACGDSVKAMALSAEAELPPERKYYLSDTIQIPLPPTDVFRTRVCEHRMDEFVTFFIQPTGTDDVYEMELRVLTLPPPPPPPVSSSGGSAPDEATALPAPLRAFLATLFLTPTEPLVDNNDAVQTRFTVQGLAAAPHEVTLRVDGARVEDNTWIIFRLLHSDAIVPPRELDNYCNNLFNDVGYGSS